MTPDKAAVLIVVALLLGILAFERWRMRAAAERPASGGKKVRIWRWFRYLLLIRLFQQCVVVSP